METIWEKLNAKTMKYYDKHDASLFIDLSKGQDRYI